MKFLTILTLALLSFSALASSEYCIATKEQIPYSSKTLWTGSCEGMDFSASSFNGKVAEENILNEITSRGFEIVGIYFDRYEMIFRRPGTTSSRIKEVCLSRRFTLDCGQGYKIVFDNKSPEAVKTYARKQGYTFLQEWSHEGEIRVLIGR